MDGPDIGPLKNFDKNLQKFYYDVIRKEVDLRVMWKCHSIRRALSDVVKAYKKRPRRKSDIRFDTPYRRCAYLLKHSACFTSAVAKYFYSLVSERHDLIEEAFKSGNLSICCLGGGPATDAVAVVHVIRFLYEPYWRENRKTLQINITVVDISEEWRETAKNVLDCLKITPEFFGNGEMTLTYNFLSADLTQKMDKQLQTTIKSADIVTMIYFLSAVTGTRGRKTCEDMVEHIMLQMKKKAFVFFLDSAVDKHYKILNKASEKRNVMREIYGPFVEEYHTISIESVEFFLSLYSKHFHRLICMTHMFFCVSSWRKPEIKGVKKIIRRELLNEPPPSWKTPTEEESELLTQKMKQYRSTVNRLINKKFNPRFNVKPNDGFRRSTFGFEKRTDSTRNSDVVSSRIFRKNDGEQRKEGSTNNSDLLANTGSIDKISLEKWRKDCSNCSDFAINVSATRPKLSQHGTTELHNHIRLTQAIVVNSG